MPLRCGTDYATSLFFNRESIWGGGLGPAARAVERFWPGREHLGSYAEVLSQVGAVNIATASSSVSRD